MVQARGCYRYRLRASRNVGSTTPMTPASASRSRVIGPAGAETGPSAVSVGGSAGTDVEIRSGVRAGDRVILDPPADLADGSRVRLKGGG